MFRKIRSRYPRSPGHRPRLEAVPAGNRVNGSHRDAPRMGRSHSVFRGSPRGSAKGGAVSFRSGAGEPVKLLEFQRRMAQDVMRPLSASGRLARFAEDGERTSARLRSYVKPNDRLSSAERLEIYNRQYWCRLLDSLAEDFPGLQAVAGKRAFANLSVAYLRDCPSRSFTLRNLGSRLLEWI